MGIAHLVEVFGNLNLHVVGDAFILLNAREQLIEVLATLLAFLLAGVGRRLVEQFLHHAEHTLHTL